MIEVSTVVLKDVRVWDFMAYLDTIGLDGNEAIPTVSLTPHRQITPLSSAKKVNGLTSAR